MTGLRLIAGGRAEKYVIDAMLSKLDDQLGGVALEVVAHLH